MQCDPEAGDGDGARTAPAGILAAPPAGPGRHSSWAFLHRAGVLAALDLRPGQRVLDLGCGQGQWAQAIHARVGPEGGAVAVDLWAQALVALRRAGPACVRADAGRPLPFAPACFDRVLLGLLAHHLAAPVRAALLAELGRVLRPGGQIVLVEFAAVPPPPGPPLARRLPGAVLRAELRGAGLVLRRVLPVAAHVDAWVTAHA